MDLFQYSFIVRALEGGLIIAVIAPLVGIFLVLRRYALIADTLAHVSLAGVALGLFLKVNPLLTALGSTVLSSVVIERLRQSRKVPSDSALAIFLSGSLAVALVLLSLAGGFGTSLFSYLFGSLLTVTPGDLVLMSGVGLLVVLSVVGLYKEFVFLSFDEEAAQVSGIPVRALNLFLILLASLVVSVAIPIVGTLLTAALMVIPALTALQFRRGFLQTLLLALAFSIIAVTAGIILSFYLNLSPGGTIVLLLVLAFATSVLR